MLYKKEPLKLVAVSDRGLSILIKSIYKVSLRNRQKKREKDERMKRKEFPRIQEIKDYGEELV